MFEESTKSLLASISHFRMSIRFVVKAYRIAIISKRRAVCRSLKSFFSCLLLWRQFRYRREAFQCFTGKPILLILVDVSVGREKHDNKHKSIAIYRCIKQAHKVLTFVDSWLDRLITCSRASVNSRLSRRTSLAWRCSSVVEPYIDDPPDINEIWLPCAVVKIHFYCRQKLVSIALLTVVILLLIHQTMVCVGWRKQARKTAWGGWCRLTPRHWAAHW